jgi:hypothetical protein
VEIELPWNLTFKNWRDSNTKQKPVENSRFNDYCRNVRINTVRYSVKWIIAGEISCLSWTTKENET